jgi:hypothetical protein
MPPPGWTVSPEFVATLLGGLRGDPLVSAVTATGLFSAIGPPQGTRYLGNPNPPPGASLDTQGITSARNSINDLAAVLGASPKVSTLNQQLLMAEAASLTVQQRRSILDGISAATRAVAHTVSLPPATSITLTSTKGQVPITILNQAGNVHPRVELMLRSPRLIFRPFSPRNGTCTVDTVTGTEVCTLTLFAQNTTLNVPVETRSSGVFPLRVDLYPPGTPVGSKRMPLVPSVQDTVRSTAVSGAAVILIAVALAALVLWWGRDLRRGRRPRGMVPSPVARDAVVDDFFDRPPPDFGDGRAEDMSPSAAAAGRTLKTETYGRPDGRETRE